MTTIYLATCGDYQDYTVLHAFARREDAEAYEDCERVEELELREGPVEKRDWWMMTSFQFPDAPHASRTDYLLDEWPQLKVDYTPAAKPPRMGGARLAVCGWDRAEVEATYRRLAAEHGISIERQEGS